MSGQNKVTPEIQAVIDRFLTEFSGKVDYIALEKWRGTRLLFGCRVTESCSRNCFSCPMGAHFGFQALGTQEDHFISGLKVWDPAIEADLYLGGRYPFLYGPEPCLQCKSFDRYAECYVRCLIYDKTMITFENVKAELTIVKNQFCVYSSRGDAESFRNELTRKVVWRALCLANAVGDNTKHHWILRALQELAWDGNQWKY